MTVADNGSILGTCPFCRAAVPESSLHLEYKVQTERTVYAECPGCREIIRPE
ncbi:DUF7837 family putative zinc-binding protein [Haladaptatus pallidirubidus]|uniref:DUF7837 family putative zinc-binding protein n=1 Tax=Haladaptatus pallidirubidus TaxID=1008152 RepID=UPI003F610357